VTDLGVVHVLFLYRQFQPRHRGGATLISLCHVFKMAGTAVQVKIFLGVLHISVILGPRSLISMDQKNQKRQTIIEERGENGS
jgi:hypothetical protein